MILWSKKEYMYVAFVELRKYSSLCWILNHVWLMIINVCMIQHSRSTFLVNWKGTQPSVWCLIRKDKSVINKVFSNNNLTLEKDCIKQHTKCVVSCLTRKPLRYGYNVLTKLSFLSIGKVLPLPYALTSLIIAIVGGWMGNGGPSQGFSMICPVIVYKLHPILTLEICSIQCC